MYRQALNVPTRTGNEEAVCRFGKWDNVAGNLDAPELIAAGSTKAHHYSLFAPNSRTVITFPSTFVRG
jgi:hypothetical protein